jgi:hypothetical protein
MTNATRGILSTMAVICLVASTAMAEEQAAIPTAGLTITRALAGKVDVTKVLAARVNPLFPASGLAIGSLNGLNPK